MLDQTGMIVNLFAIIVNAMAILRFSLKFIFCQACLRFEKKFSKIWEFLTLRPLRATTFFGTISEIFRNFRFEILIQHFFSKIFLVFKNTVNIKRNIFFVFDKEFADVEHF